MNGPNYVVNNLGRPLFKVPRLLLTQIGPVLLSMNFRIGSHLKCFCEPCVACGPHTGSRNLQLCRGTERSPGGDGPGSVIMLCNVNVYILLILNPNKAVKI